MFVLTGFFGLYHDIKKIFRQLITNQYKTFISSSVSSVKLAYCISAVMALMSGVSIYAFFRNLNIVLFQFFSKPFFIDSLYISVNSDTLLMSMFLFNLPDGLWFLSGVLFIRAIWLTNIKLRIVYFCSFSFIAFFLEIIQVFENIPGTFDVLDLTFFVFFALLESIIFNMFIRRSIL